MTVVESVRFDDEEQVLVASVMPYKKQRSRRGLCRRRCPRYDGGTGVRRWRTLDLGTWRAYLQAPSYRVQCPDHGVVAAAVPWARHDVGFTLRFEDTVAWLAVHADKSLVGTLMRVAWRTVGRIVERVAAASPQLESRFKNLRRIGVDEISYRKGRRYLVVVVDHDTGNLIWAAPGRDAKTLRRFFDLLGEEACARIEEVSADAAKWIANAVKARCPNATLCLDPFHIVAWATDALDKVRRDVWNKARREGQKVQAKAFKGARFALWRNPEDLTKSQSKKLNAIQRTNRPLHRAYPLKEQLRLLLELPAKQSPYLLKEWLAWASRSRIPAFVELGRRIRRHRAGVEAMLVRRLSNALVESTNTKTRLALGNPRGIPPVHPQCCPRRVRRGLAAAAVLVQRGLEQGAARGAGPHRDAGPRRPAGHAGRAHDGGGAGRGDPVPGGRDDGRHRPAARARQPSRSDHAVARHAGAGAGVRVAAAGGMGDRRAGGAAAGSDRRADRVRAAALGRRSHPGVVAPRAGARAGCGVGGCAARGARRA